MLGVDLKHNIGIILEIRNHLSQKFTIKIEHTPKLVNLRLQKIKELQQIMVIIFIKST